MTARELRPLGRALGTEALGVDLSRPLDDETFAWIEEAFAEHPVLVFRDQDLGPAELAAFGRRFGKPKIHSLVDYRHAEFPEVSWLTNVDKDGNIDWFGVKRATDWHTDWPYEEVPPRLAILHAKRCRPRKAVRCSRTCAPPTTRWRMRCSADWRVWSDCMAGTTAPPASGSTTAIPSRTSTANTRKKPGRR